MRKETPFEIDIRVTAKRFLDRCGLGKNKANVTLLKDAVERAVIEYEAEISPSQADVREGEDPKEHPFWREDKC